MRYKLCLSLLFSSFAIFTFGQAQKIVFLEGLGTGVYASANFDMRIKKDSRDGFGFRAGIGNSFFLDENITTIPFGINYLFGKNKSSLLLGANGTLGLFNNEREDVFDRRNSQFIPSLELGYRFRPMVKGIAFQFTVNSFFNTVDRSVPLFFGAGVGYAWK